MKERPILFSAAMVRALLDGSKAQTRRVMRVQPYWAGEGKPWAHWHIDAPDGSYSGPFDPETYERSPGAWFPYSGCPYGVPGDRLWVREAFRVETTGEPRYRASVPETESLIATWKPSIHMPRGASRLMLEVTDVRVQRVQDISEDDARAEGASHLGSNNNGYIGGFRELWQSLNFARGYGWNQNPWVWAVTFRVL